jgi:hypothetical protein
VRLRALSIAAVVALLAMTSAPTARAEPPPSSAPSSAPPSEGPRVARVVFRADEDEAVLQTDWAPVTRAGGPVMWSVVCAAPCEAEVRGDARFRAAGRTSYDSAPFVLPPRRDRVVVTAEMATKSMVAPALLIVAGYATLAVVGPLLIGTGIAAGDDMGPRTRTGLIVSGSIVAGVGLAAATAGVVMIVKRAQRKESRVVIARNGGLAF